MKKRILFFICCFAGLLLCACKGEELIKNVRLSELRSDIFIGEGNGHKAVVVTGIRENPFEIDGLSNPNKAEFTIITIMPNEYKSAEYTFKADIGGTEYSGKMVRHPFNQSYSAEIAILCAQNEINIIINGGTEISIKAQSIKEDAFIDGNKAFEIAEKKLKKNIDEKKGSEYEIFVRLIENPINAAGGYFWYVAYVFEDNTTYAVLIEPTTMEIAALKN